MMMAKEKNNFLGKRIKFLREKEGLSQEDLAGRIHLSRSTISQIETGTRSVQAVELQEIAQLFSLTADQLLDSSREIEIILEDPKPTSNKSILRVLVARENIDKFKEVLIYILSRVGSKPNIGQTVLYKLLYFIDFDFYEKHEEQLIGATYIKNKFGPTPVAFKKIVDEMIQNEEIVEVKNKHFEYDQTKYLPLRGADLKKLGAHEIDMIDDVLRRLSHMNAKTISEYSHGDVPWLTAEEGENIEYEAVYYRNQPYSVRSYDEQSE